jgi:hypothetical protein
LGNGRSGARDHEWRQCRLRWLSVGETEQRNLPAQRLICCDKSGDCPKTAQCHRRRAGAQTMVFLRCGDGETAAVLDERHGFEPGWTVCLQLHPGAASSSPGGRLWGRVMAISLRKPGDSQLSPRLASDKSFVRSCMSAMCSTFIYILPPHLQPYIAPSQTKLAPAGRQRGGTLMFALSHFRTSACAAAKLAPEGRLHSHFCIFAFSH